MLHIADLINIQARMARPVYSNYCLLGIIAGVKNMESALHTHRCLRFCVRQAIRMFRVVGREGGVTGRTDSKGIIEMVYEGKEDAMEEMGDEVKPVKRTKKVKGGTKSKSKGPEKIKAKERLEEYRKMVLKGGSGGNE